MKAAIFDMDGTLVETLEMHLESFLTVCERHGIDVQREFIEKRFGMTAAEIFADVMEEQGLELESQELAEEKYEEYDRIAKNVRVFPGAVELLKGLKEKGVKTAIATGAGRSNFDSTIRGTELNGLADATITAEDGRGKPHPDLFLAAAEKLETKAEECVVFEDAVYGLMAAKKAGMRTIAVTTGITKKEELEKENPDRIVDSLSKIDPEEILTWN